MNAGPSAASFDQRMMALVLVFSSSEPARAAAAAWLSAFDRARANGVAVAEAQRHAALAATQALAGRGGDLEVAETGGCTKASGMLPRDHAARAPPARI